MQYEGQMADQQMGPILGGALGGGLAAQLQAAQLQNAAQKPKDMTYLDGVQSGLTANLCSLQDMISEITCFNDRMSGAEPPAESPRGSSLAEGACLMDRLTAIMEQFNRDLADLQQQISRLRRLG